jgi:hypothetical protein
MAVNDDRPQRGQAYVDRDMVNFLLRLGFPIGAAAALVGNVLYETGDRGVHTVIYGDLRSEVGEAYLRNFVRDILTTYPSKFERELHAMAKRGEMITPVEQLPARPQISDEQLARIKDRVRGAF